jgi:hypothetical protein
LFETFSWYLSIVFSVSSIIIFLICIIILGTQVAGIIAANATDITQTGYIPVEPFLGVAPQATIGSCKVIVSSIEPTHLFFLLLRFIDRIFGCLAGNTTSGRDETTFFVIILILSIYYPLLTFL